MSANFTLLKVPENAQKQVAGHYLLLVKDLYDENKQRWYSDWSLVGLSRSVDPTLNIDWEFLEMELIEKGIAST